MTDTYFKGTVGPRVSIPPSSSVTEHDLKFLLRQASGALRKYLETRIPETASRRILADEILQEVWVAAFKSADLLTKLPSDEVMNWLLRVANRRLVSAIRFHMSRKRSANREVILRDVTSSLVNLFDRIAAPGRTPSSQASNNEVANEVRLAIERLPEISRRAIWMHHIDGLDRQKIAEQLDKTPDAVRGILYRGMIQLTHILRDTKKCSSSG
ncbi:MAG TPA: sigma-70 family RNA polymerase sigma factor [Phycisphaerae bacterium]|nr:sigma-70 family RNA polymerase sigma factor [Phycisphaerae bacterium]